MADYKNIRHAGQERPEDISLHAFASADADLREHRRRRGNELLQHLGITATTANTNGLGTLHFYRRAQSGNFKLWGASGSDGDAHLEHLRYIGEFFEELPLAKQIPEPSTSAISALACVDSWPRR